MRYTDLTYLIFVANGLVDEGKRVDFEELRDATIDGQLFPLLKKSFGDAIDLTIYDEPRLKEVSDRLSEIAGGVDGRERKKCLVERNGLCLLVAYATEGLQRMCSGDIPGIKSGR